MQTFLKVLAIWLRGQEVVYKSITTHCNQRIEKSSLFTLNRIKSIMWSSRSQNHNKVWKAIFDNLKWILKIIFELEVNSILMSFEVRVYYENSYN